MVSALISRLTTARFTLRRPYIARSVLKIEDISLAQYVQVSRGYRLAPDRSSLIYGRNRLQSRLAKFERPSKELGTYCRTQS